MPYYRGEAFAMPKSSILYSIIFIDFVFNYRAPLKMCQKQCYAVSDESDCRCQKMFDFICQKVQMYIMMHTWNVLNHQMCG